MDFIFDLGMSSLSASRLGIAGLVQLGLVAGGGFWLISLLSRHGDDPPSVGVFGVLVAVMCAALVGAIGGFAVMILFVGIAAVISSGPFLGFGWKHRVILGVLMPVLYVAAYWLGHATQNWILENQ